MLINNINYLRERYPYIREELREIEENKDKKFSIEETRSGDKTLIYREDENETYFHSKYSPTREANALIEEYKDTKNKNIIFYGTGLGYHIDLLMSENPDNNYYIFEPIPEVLECFLSERDLSRKQYKNLKVLSMGMKNISEDLDSLIDLNRQEVYIIELPTHKQVFEKEFEIFNEIFLNIVKEKRSSIGVNYTFQRRWIINSMKNFKEVLKTPNIILEKEGKFKGKPVILVAAGPSLNEEIENLKYIKKNGLAYIVSVGSAINTLIYNDIYPDVATTYDPGEINQKIFRGIKEKDIKDIPIIFGSSVGYETIENYPGEKYHMITSQDKISSYFLNDKEKELNIVLDAPTIAVITLQLIVYLGFETIILAGQNLAYLGSHQHSKGVYNSKSLTDEELNKAVKVENVYGKDILTTNSYNSMREQMETYIQKLSEGQVINTTKNGAKIKGTEFIELEKLIEDKLRETVVEKDWLKGHNHKYNEEVLKSKLEKMDKSILDSKRSIKNFNSELQKTFSLVRNGNFQQVNRGYQSLDVSINELESNSFFTTFILQINRIQHKLLADAVKISRLERNIYKKNIVLLMAYQEFISKCIEDIEFIMPLYEEMKKIIVEYIEEAK